MAPNRKPTSVTIRSYQVGFGDCFLVSFNYGEDDKAERRHVLIDFGSTSLPKQGGFSLDSVAKDIKEKTGGKLTAVVATHRHRDHISGFGGETGKLIADLHPDVVVQPWTEDPKAQPGATSPPAALEGAKGFVGALAAMHDVARFSLQEIAALRAPKTVKEQIAFLGDDNLANLDAVKTLMNMSGEHVYVYYGSKSGLEKVLPGVKVHVLGPPTLKQSRAIEKQRDEDKDEFWHLQAKASRRAAATGKPLFPRAAQVTGSVLPVETRWFLPQDRGGSWRSTPRDRADPRQADEQHERDPAVRGRHEEAAVPRRCAAGELDVLAEGSQGGVGGQEAAVEGRRVQGRPSRQPQRDAEDAVEPLSEEEP